jgi:hypothetical protein
LTRGAVTPQIFDYLKGVVMLKRFTAIALFASLAGCATVMNSSTQTIKLETKTAENTIVTGAECKISNDYGSVPVKSGDSATVRRSSDDLDIVCKHPDNPDATARAVSRVNGGMFGNIIFGGVIGAVIDHSKGTAYTYPTWIQLVFGKALTFDRDAEKSGQPVPHTESISTQAQQPQIQPSDKAALAAAPEPTGIATLPEGAVHQPAQIRPAWMDAKIEPESAPQAAAPAKIPAKSAPKAEKTKPAIVAKADSKPVIVIIPRSGVVTK